MKFSAINQVIVFLFLFSLSSCTEQAEFYDVTGKMYNDCIYASGEVVPQDYFLIKSSTSTEILKINVSEDDMVHKGDILVLMGTQEDTRFSEINESQLTQSRKNSHNTSETLRDIKEKIILANSRYELDKKNAEIYRDLFLKQAVTKHEVDQQYLKEKSSRSKFLSLQKQYVIKKGELNNFSLEREKQLIKSKRLLRSPISGKIFAVNKRDGDISKADETIMTVGKAHDFKLELLVDERDIRKVRLGQTVYFDSDIYPDRQLMAKIARIYPEVQKDTRSFKIDAKIVERNIMLYPGLAIEANIIVNTMLNAVLIPKRFLSKGNFLRLIKSGLTKDIRVRTGKEINGWVEIVSGLKIGDRIVLNTK